MGSSAGDRLETTRVKTPALASQVRAALSSLWGFTTLLELTHTRKPKDFESQNNHVNNFQLSKKTKA